MMGLESLISSKSSKTGEWRAGSTRLALWTVGRWRATMMMMRMGAEEGLEEVAKSTWAGKRRGYIRVARVTRKA